ncbi:hypothetical protein NFI96_024246, partial [Prochilodus magdalenae]
SLLPPRNLSVNLLDFQGSVHWLPGPGNPTGTRYFVEFTEIKNFLLPVWKRPADCTNVTSMQCYLVLEQLFTDYIMRVMAEWKDEKSNWTYMPHTFQLYKDTQLSPPAMRIFPDQHSVQIQLSHLVQSVTELPLRFSVDLFQLTSDNGVQHIGRNTSTGFLKFFPLPTGYRYCINASAFYTEMTLHQYLNATECILLQDQGHRGGVPYIISTAVGVGVILLLLIPTGIVLGICFTGDSYIPKALQIIKRPSRILTLNQVETYTYTYTLTLTPGTNETTFEGKEENASSVYIGKVLIAGDQLNSHENGTEPVPPEAVDDLPPQRNLYSSAINMEDTEDEETLEEGFPAILPRTNPDGACREIPQPDSEYEENGFLLFCLISSESSKSETDSEDIDSNAGHSYEPRPDLHFF